MALDDVFRITLVQSLDESRISNSFYVEETALYTGVQATTDIGIDFTANILTEWVNIVSDEITFCNIQVHQVRGITTPPSLELLIAETGSITGQAMPASSCIQFQLRQLTATNRNNGALNMAGILETDTDGNDYDVTARSIAIANLDAAILAGLDAAGGPANGHWEFVVRTKAVSGGGSPAVPNYHQITSVHLNPLVYNMRPRARNHMALAP